MSAETSQLDDLRAEIRRFVSERDWEQFHTPKNLVMALAVEVSDLMEHFQWLSDSEASNIMANDTTATAIRDELGDVLIYLVRLADVLSVNLLAAAASKVEKNRLRYPVETARGSSEKAQ